MAVLTWLLGNIRSEHPRASQHDRAAPERPSEMPPELQAALDESRRLDAELKAEWDRRRDAAYETYFNEPSIVEKDEKAHSLRDQVIAWEAQFQKPAKKKNHSRLDLTTDKIADGPRPAGARPTLHYFSLALDCRDAALVRDEAIYRGITEGEVERRFMESWVRDLRSRVESTQNLAGPGSFLRVTSNWLSHLWKSSSLANSTTSAAPVPRSGVSGSSWRGLPLDFSKMVAASSRACSRCCGFWRSKASLASITLWGFLVSSSVMWFILYVYLRLAAAFSVAVAGERPPIRRDVA
jgi:hypothetical protein